MPLETQNIPLGPEGMNVVEKPWTIPDGQARWIQDGVLDKANMLRRRGPVKKAKNAAGTDFATVSDYVIGIVGTERPDDLWKVALIGGATQAHLSVLSTDYTSTSDCNFSPVGLVFDSAKRYNYHTSPHPRGGTFIGTQDPLAPTTQTILAHWYGATKVENESGTITVAQDSTAVVGVGTTWDNDVEPGMFMYSRADVDLSSAGDRTFIGVVKSVTDDTHLTLLDGALFAVTGQAVRFNAMRPVSRRVAKGTITCTTKSKIVTGHLTKFQKQKLGTPTGTGHWALLQADTMKYIGLVATTQSDIQLTLTANAALTCNKDKFVAIDLYDGRNLRVDSVEEPGWITAGFAGRTWYANRPHSDRRAPYAPSRVWFSDIFDPEALDLTVDGDHILIPSSEPPIKPITGMIGTASCLLIFKEDETYGIFGTDETNFTVRKLNNDGAFCPMVIQQWRDGVIFAGQRGIWFFDGTEVFNLVEDRLGDFYEKAVQKFPSRTYKAWSMMYNDNYFLYIDKADPPFGPDKTENDDNGLGTPQGMLSMVIQMERRAVSFLTNFAFHGSVRSPFEDTLGVLYCTNEVNSSGTHQGGRIGQARDLFDSVGVDAFRTDVINAADRVLGPDFYFESKRYDLGEPQVKKRLKQLMLNYRLDSIGGEYVSLGYTGAGATDFDDNYLKFATLVGLNDIATISSGKFPITRVRDNTKTWREGFQNKRLKFNKRSQHLGFKIWQSSNDIERLEIGPAALGFKWMRKGRV